MSTPRNLIRQTITNNPGAGGNITAGPAVAQWLALVAGDDGLPFDLKIEQPGVGKEVRTDCVYTHATTSLTRGALVSSTTGAAINLTSAAVFEVVLEASRVLRRDSNGAVLANVAHRTGALSSLMALAGSAGEISVATDQAASVLHTGTPGQARMLRPPQGTLMLAASHNPGARNLVSGILTTVTGWTAPTYDPLSLLNITTGVVDLSLLPSWSQLTVRTSVRFENRVNNGVGVRYVFASFTNGDLLQANVLPLVWSAPLSTIPLGTFHASTDERTVLSNPTPGAALSIKMYSTAGSSIEGWVTSLELWMIPA